MPCPKCNSTNIIKRGTRRTKRMNKIRYKFSCNDCNFNFVLRDKTFRSPFKLKVLKKIEQLSKTKDRNKSKQDRTRKVTYSNSKIANIVYAKYGIKVSQNFVWKYLNKK